MQIVTNDFPIVLFAPNPVLSAAVCFVLLVDVTDRAYKKEVVEQRSIFLLHLNLNSKLEFLRIFLKGL